MAAPTLWNTTICQNVRCSWRNSSPALSRTGPRWSMPSCLDRRFRKRVPSRMAKRILDALVAGTGLLVLAPLLALIAVAIGLSMGTPILFRQRRPGLHGQAFE